MGIVANKARPTSKLAKPKHQSQHEQTVRTGQDTSNFNRLPIDTPDIVTSISGETLDIQEFPALKKVFSST
jgi:hypothetical protein